MILRFHKIGSLLFCASLAMGADVRIVGVGGDQAVPVSLQAFQAGSDQESALFLEVLRMNLDRWGWFRVVEGGNASVQIKGSARAAGRNFAVDVEAVEVRTGRSVYRQRFREELSEARSVALRVADGITEAIHSVPGVAATRIAFIGTVGGKQDLYTIGADGQAMMQITRDGTPAFRPSWDTRANAILYTSFVRGFPDVYRLDLDGGRRAVVSREAGMNAGASVSPDGRRLVLVLSRDGNPEIYVRDLSDGRVTRITRTPHNAEASPVWSPDGRQIAFVSDMQGGPHVFVVSSEGGQPQRISRGGSQNVSPSWGPDGRIMYSSRRLGRFQLVVYDPKSGLETQITDAPVDHENPSWARDGRHVVYARRDGRISTLYLLDLRSNGQIRLTTRPGDWYFPAWSSN
jgi:TolB protein